MSVNNLKTFSFSLAKTLHFQYGTFRHVTVPTRQKEGQPCVEPSFVLPAKSIQAGMDV